MGASLHIWGARGEIIRAPPPCPKAYTLFFSPRSQLLDYYGTSPVVLVGESELFVYIIRGHGLRS